MKTETENLLHKIEGTVHAQFVTCGKRNCKCSRGELHGAYFYHFVRINGRLTKRYLKAEEVEETRIACQRRQCEEKAECRQSQAVWKQLRELRASLRELQNYFD